MELQVGCKGVRLNRSHVKNGFGGGTIFERRMELPVTREQLLAYAADYPMIERKAAIDKTVADIFKEIRRHIITCNPNAKAPSPVVFGGCVSYVDITKLSPTSFAWRPSGRLAYHWGNGHGSNFTIDEVVAALNEAFVGCKIIVDPLKTYILIDWS